MPVEFAGQVFRMRDLDPVTMINPLHEAVERSLCGCPPAAHGEAKLGKVRRVLYPVRDQLEERLVHVFAVRAANDLAKKLLDCRPIARRGFDSVTEPKVQATVVKLLGRI